MNTTKKQAYYMRKQSEARDEAIAWQSDFANHDYSYGELIAFQNHFRELGKRYGLLREFRENGIC